MSGTSRGSGGIGKSPVLEEEGEGKGMAHHSMEQEHRWVEGGLVDLGASEGGVAVRVLGLELSLGACGVGGHGRHGVEGERAWSRRRGMRGGVGGARLPL